MSDAKCSSFSLELCDQSYRQSHRIAFRARKRVLSLDTLKHVAVVFFLRFAAFLAPFTGLAHWERISVTHWRGRADLRLRKEAKHDIERICFTLCLEMKSHVSFVLPVESTDHVPKQDVGRLEKAEAREDLAWVEEIDGNRRH